MKRADINLVRPPIDPVSAISSQRLYRVILGNHRVVLFSSERHADAYSAEAMRDLNDALLCTNLLLADLYVGYRNAWPLLSSNGANGKRWRDTDVHVRGYLRTAEDCMDRTITHTGGESGPFFAWRWVAQAAGAMRAAGLLLAELYRLKSNAVERHRMDLLVRRCNEVQAMLQHYGQELPHTAVGSSGPPL